MWMAHLPKEIFEAGEYFRFHFSDENNLGLVSWGNESLNASINVCISLIGLRYWLDVGASINKKSGESILNLAGQKVWDAENGKLEGTGLLGKIIIWVTIMKIHLRLQQRVGRNAEWKLERNYELE